MRCRAIVDDFVRRNGLDVPHELAPAARPAPWADEAACLLDVDRAGIGTIVWAHGLPSCLLLAARPRARRRR
jgi:hypothetical protein